jgi:DNA-binding transcriptional LysR family regulator
MSNSHLDCNMYSAKYHIGKMKITFNLKLLPILVTLYEQDSVTKTATKLGMSQSTVSSALAELRSLYGDQLFIRLSHGLEPTTRAASIVGNAQDILRRLEQAMAPNAEFNPAKDESTFTLALHPVAEFLFFSEDRGQGPAIQSACQFAFCVFVRG